DLFKVDEQGFPRRSILYAVQDEITRIVPVTFDMHLRREDTAPVFADCEVNVSGPELVLKRVGNGLDRAEIVLPAGIGQKPPVALEVSVAAAGVRSIRVNVGSLAVDLPDFDERVAYGFAGFAQYASGQVRDFSDGRSDRVIDDEEIVVRVERHLIRIKRSFPGAGSLGESFGKKTWRGECRSTEDETTYESPSSMNV